MQHIDRLVDLAAQAVRHVGQHFPGGRIDMADALRGGQNINVRKVTSVGERQLAQVRQVHRLERSKLSHGRARAAVHFGRNAGLADHAVRQNAERRKRHVAARQRRQDQPKYRETAEFGMQPLRCRAADRAQDRRPAAQSCRQHHRARNRQDDHGQRANPGCRAAHIVHQERAVQVGDKLDEARRLIRPDCLPGGRVNQIRPCSVAVEIINDDRARGCFHDPVDLTMCRRYRLGQRRHADLPRLGQGGASPLQHRIKRQDGAGNGQHRNQEGSDQTGQRVNLTKHGGGPVSDHMSKVKDCTYPLPDVGLPALALVSGTTTSAG